MHYFESMCLVYNIPTIVEHCACMFDLHGHDRHLHEVEELIKEMHYEPNAYVWMALLSGCKVYGSVEMVDQLQNKFELDHGNSIGHVMLSNTSMLDISKVDISEMCSITKIRKGCEEASRVELLIQVTRGIHLKLKTIIFTNCCNLCKISFRLLRQMNDGGDMPYFLT